MASNKQVWIGNVDGGGPLIMRGLFDAGSTTAIKRGEILEKTGTGNTVWVPMDSDYDMTATSDAVAVADEEIKTGDRAGYYNIIVPRPGDVFEFELAAAGATAVGTSLYYSASQKVTVTTGTYILGYAVGQENYPQKQGHLADDGSPDAGTTVKSQTYVRMTFRLAVSYYAAMFI